MKSLQKILNKCALFLIYIYQKIFSPSLGILRYLPFYPKPSCVFYPTCSEYGRVCFTKYPFLKAFRKTIGRISRCHPYSTPRVDKP